MEKSIANLSFQKLKRKIERSLTSAKFSNTALMLFVLGILSYGLPNCSSQTNNRLSDEMFIHQTKILEDSLNYTNTVNSEMLLKYRASQNVNDSLTVTETLESASLVRNHSEWIGVSLNNLMIDIVKNTERSNTAISNDGVIDFSALMRISDVKIPQDLLFADTGDSQAWIIRAILEEFKTEYGKILNTEPELKVQFEALIDTREQIPVYNGKDKENIKWEQYYFGQKSEGEILITLLRLQLSVNRAESLLLSALLNN